MKGVAFLVALLPSPALSWDFTPIPICTLSQNEASIETRVTYDPGSGDYAIALTLPNDRWPSAAAFGIRFEGGQRNIIVTDRHVLSNEDATLTVTDRGFGNVLNGLEFNNLAIAMAGDTAVPITLDGAAESVQAFRACVAGPGV